MKHIISIKTFLKHNNLNKIFIIFILVLIGSEIWYNTSNKDVFMPSSNYNEDLNSYTKDKFTLKEAEKKIDSIKQLIERTKKFNNSEEYSGTSIAEFKLIKIGDYFHYEHSPNRPSKNYIGIPGFETKTIQFFIANGDSNIIKNTYNEGAKKKYVKYRYNYTNKTILIPIADKYFKFIQIVCFAMLVVFIVFGMACTYLPIKVLAKIAAGKPFLYINYVELIFAAKTTLLLSLSLYLLQLIFYFVYCNQIKGDLYFPFLKNLLHYKYSFLFSMALYTVAQAFKKGTCMEEEQELTV